MPVALNLEVIIENGRNWAGFRASTPKTAEIFRSQDRKTRTRPPGSARGSSGSWGQLLVSCLQTRQSGSAVAEEFHNRPVWVVLRICESPNVPGSR